MEACETELTSLRGHLAAEQLEGAKNEQQHLRAAQALRDELAEAKRDFGVAEKEHQASLQQLHKSVMQILVRQNLRQWHDNICKQFMCCCICPCACPSELTCKLMSAWGKALHAGMLVVQQDKTQR